jgi:anti-sigma factor RsiW
MNHDTAVRNYAVDRYVLNEMSDADREDYEAHFFECFACAREVVTAFEFMEDLRVIFASGEFC